MKVNGLGHIGINTGDFKKSLHFYQDILGCRKINFTDWGDSLMTTLELPGGGLIELFDHGFKTPSVQEQNAVGYRHIAFVVDDVSAWEEHLRENGVEITMRPTVMEQIHSKGMLCLDPDGIEVELYERI
jgi:glyoxylase I family protein